MTLPEPTEAAEDRFVSRWRDDNASTESLVEATEAALAKGRPQLAARLAQLLDARSGPSMEPHVTRALQASRLRLVRDLAHDAESDEDALREHQLSRSDRFRSRQRASLDAPRGIAGEGTRSRRKGRGRRRR